MIDETETLKADLDTLVEIARRNLHNTGAWLALANSAVEISAILEKQIPKPTNKTMRDSEETHDRCPNCGAFAYGRFCADCGQKLDWEVVVSKTESTTGR